MQITIEVSQSIIDQIQTYAEKKLNRPLSKNELIKFLQTDIESIYEISLDDGMFTIKDSLDHYFDNLK
jgi:hypothetical protein